MPATVAVGVERRSWWSWVQENPPTTVHVHVLMMDIPFGIAEQLPRWTSAGCELLLELSRLGSMRRGGGRARVTTSTVSQQIAALAREVGTPLVEPARPAGAAHPGRPPACRARRDDPGRRRRRPARPRPGRRAGRHRAGGRLRHRGAAHADAGRRGARGGPPRRPPAHPRARAVRGVRPAGGGRRRPRADLRLQPRAVRLRHDAGGDAALDGAVEPRRAGRRRHAARERGRRRGVPPLPRATAGS